MPCRAAKPCPYCSPTQPRISYSQAIAGAKLRLRDRVSARDAGRQVGAKHEAVDSWVKAMRKLHELLLDGYFPARGSLQPSELALFSHFNGDLIAATRALQTAKELGKRKGDFGPAVRELLHELQDALTTAIVALQVGNARAAAAMRVDPRSARWWRERLQAIHFEPTALVPHWVNGSAPGREQPPEHALLERPAPPPWVEGEPQPSGVEAGGDALRAGKPTPADGPQPAEDYFGDKSGYAAEAARAQIKRWEATARRVYAFLGDEANRLLVEKRSGILLSSPYVKGLYVAAVALVDDEGILEATGEEGARSLPHISREAALSLVKLEHGSGFVSPETLDNMGDAMLEVLLLMAERRTAAAAAVPISSAGLMLGGSGASPSATLSQLRDDDLLDGQPLVPTPAHPSVPGSVRRSAGRHVALTPAARDVANNATLAKSAFDKNAVLASALVGVETSARLRLAFYAIHAEPIQRSASRLFGFAGTARHFPAVPDTILVDTMQFQTSQVQFCVLALLRNRCDNRSAHDVQQYIASHAAAQYAWAHKLEPELKRFDSLLRAIEHVRHERTGRTAGVAAPIHRGWPWQRRRGQRLPYARAATVAGGAAGRGAAAARPGRGERGARPHHPVRAAHSDRQRHPAVSRRRARHS